MSPAAPRARTSPFEGGFARVAITDRRGCPRPLRTQVLRLAGSVDAVILRERDLDDAAYVRLAQEVLAACSQIGAELIIHGRPRAARDLGLGTVHLPLPQLFQEGRPKGFSCVGTNIHELDEIGPAEALGADYLVASPIFTPSCKPDAEPRGIAFLAEAVSLAQVPVLALGGMRAGNEPEIRAAGAAGACRMSDWMRS